MTDQQKLDSIHRKLDKWLIKLSDPYYKTASVWEYSDAEDRTFRKTKRRQYLFRVIKRPDVLDRYEDENAIEIWARGITEDGRLELDLIDSAYDLFRNSRSLNATIVRVKAYVAIQRAIDMED